MKVSYIAMGICLRYRVRAIVRFCGVMRTHPCTLRSVGPFCVPGWCGTQSLGIQNETPMLKTARLTELTI